MKVFGVQMNLTWEDPEANMRRAEEWICQGAAMGADLLCFPEMFATGFSMNVAKASQARDESEKRLGSLANELNVAVLFGTAEKTDDGCGKGVNVALALNKKGQTVAKYEKIHPFSYAEEHKHYRGGNALSVFDVSGVRVTPFVCYDLRFPEVFRAAADASHLMVVIANWPAARRHAWRSLLVARAIENQCFVLGVNRVGEGKGLTYAGDSLFVDPLGEIRAQAANQEALVGGDVTPSEVETIRGRFPFLRDRRPGVYQQLQSTLEGSTE